MGMGDQRHASAALPPGKIRHPLHRRLGGLHDQSRRVQNMSAPPAFESRTFQLLVTRYTDWVILVNFGHM